jgi:hypothetical protein
MVRRSNNKDLTVFNEKMKFGPCIPNPRKIPVIRALHTSSENGKCGEGTFNIMYTVYCINYFF